MKWTEVEQSNEMVHEEATPAPQVNTALCALSAGGLGALVGNPADLALIRMQTDSMLPAAERAGYTNVFSALGGIIKHEGPMGLFAGAPPTVTRAMALNPGRRTVLD